MFDKCIYEENKGRYPQSELVVIMTIKSNEVQYLSLHDQRDEPLFMSNSEYALLFDGFELAKEILSEMGLADQSCYIVPLAAVQILRGVMGGVAPTNTVYLTNQ